MLFDAAPAADREESKFATSVGVHGVTAGAGIPIFLVVPGPHDVDIRKLLLESGAGGPAAIILPTRKSLNPTWARVLTDRGDALLFLDGLVILRNRRLALAAPAEELLAKLRETIRAEKKEVHAWILPPETTWRELKLELIADCVLLVHHNGQTRRFEPAHLDMVSTKDGKPTLDWIILQTVIESGGILSWSNPAENKRLQKRKQLLCTKLREQLGIQADPIVWRPRQHSYEAQFMVLDSRPLELRRRKFADRKAVTGK